MEKEDKDHSAELAAVVNDTGPSTTVAASGVVLCRCGHERDDHGSRTEMRRGEKVYIQKCEYCPCEVFTDKDGPLSRMIDGFHAMSQFPMRGSR